MSEQLDAYYENAQLSLAAYGTFPPGVSLTSVLTGSAVGFSQVLAEEFSQEYTVVSQSVPSGTGFSATLFQRNDGTKILAIRGTELAITDLTADALIGLGTNYNPQYTDLLEYYQSLIDQDLIAPLEQVTVTGHSLGGYLAARLATALPGAINHVYTYNTPGTGGVWNQFLEAFGWSPSTPNPKITNIISGNDASLIAGLGTLQGDVQKVFIEVGSSVDNHRIGTLTDSLALYGLFGRVDQNVTAAAITDILNAAATAGQGSLEHALFSLRALFQSPPGSLTLDTPLGRLEEDERDAYYLNIQTLGAFLSGVPTGTLTVESLVNQPVGTVAAHAELPPEGLNPLAYRYALTQLNPFVIHGVDYDRHNTTGELELVNLSAGTGALTHDYLFDRALFLSNKIAANLSDSITIGGSTHFQDLATGYELNPSLVVPSFVRDHVIFGADIAETIAGGDHDDQLYGGDGVDTLLGNAGIDYLQGDAGNDTLNGGSGADRMVGGQGNDTYIVDNAGDSVTEGLNNGSDTVESAVSFSFSTGDNLEDLTLTGTADINGTGNELDNLIIGNGGVNRLSGNDGEDTLQSGGGDDILAGGTGSDLLEGGAGFDTYYYNAGDGTDRIEDSDATGKIVFNGGLLQGGISTDGGNTYVSLDGAETYVLSGGHLIVNGVLTVNADFQSGQFGIQLDDLSDLPTNTGVPTGPFQAVITGTDERNFLGRATGSSGPGDAVFGLGGNDNLLGLFIGDDLLDGGAGDDFLIGYSGDDYLDGGPGNDYLNASDSINVALIYDGNDILLGGIGDDVLYAGGLIEGIGESDYLDGGDGADYLWAGRGTDVLLGGEGNDLLRGDNRPEGWPTAFVDFDGFFILVPGEAIFTTTGGDDFLEGGSGNDILVGDGGNDILSGGADNDQLFGDEETGYLVSPGDDVLDGGSGDDLLAAGDGNDSLSGGTGVDELYGDMGTDILDGGDNADTLHGGDGGDELYGGGGNDLLYGDGLNNRVAVSAAGAADFLDGGDGDDELQGGIGADTLFGGAGNDRLFGDEDNDILFGDAGNDQLQGGAGNDRLGGDAGDDLLLGQEGEDELFGDAGDDQLGGNEGNDSLYGGAGNDILEGFQGNDVLVGGAGNDAYNFSIGDGQDTITDTAQASEGNLIQFFPGITVASLTFIHDQAQQMLTIQVGGGGDSIRLLGFDPNTFNYVVNTLSFANGTVVALADQLPLPGGLIEGTDESNNIRTGSTDDTIFAGAGNDTVDAGGGNDTLIGGSGNDVLTGGTGQDAYVFNSGDGSDRVSDGPGEGNRLVLGPGISSSSVTLGLGAGGSLSVRTGMAGDAIQILANLEGGDSPSIDAVEFADGTTLSIGALFSRGIEITGTAGSDTLTGTSLIDRISGGAGDDFVVGGLSADILRGDEGNDQLFGSDGADLLDGGAGTDVLNGEVGQDTYVFGRGYGQDILRDAPVEESGPNTIQFTSGVSPDEVRLQARQSEDGVNVVLTIDGTLDELTLLGAADPSLLPISQILFADGTSWETAEILTRIEGLRLTAPATGSVLEGTGFRDELIGAQGNDDLDGLGGADRMVGGAGDDHYWVNDAGDRVVESVGEGSDTVLSQIDYTLPDHVENLILRTTNVPTTDPVRGEGNARDNVLLGNFVNNVLIGGAGNDIFWGGFSIGSDYGSGNDDLYGGAGNDTYVVEGDFNGFDTVHDVALPGEGNRLQFGTSVRPDDVVFVQDGSTLRITSAGGAHGAVLADFDPSGIAGSLVTEVVAFSGGVEDVTGGYETRLLALMNPTLGTDNGESVTGTSQADVIKAQGGDDVIAGGLGNDVLLGGTGNDIYVFNVGDGFDLINDQPGAGDINRVQFAAGITQEMLRVSYSGTSSMGGLTVRVGTSGDGLHFLGVPSEDPTGPHAVDTFHFADGTQLTFTQLFEREVLVQGTGRSDGELFGTFADDRMLGLGGSEALSSGEGNDTLIGGTGNDILQGGAGSDIYAFNPGDGVDEIRDDPGEQGSFDVNRLQFGTGITASDLVLFDAGDGFTVNRIAVGTSGDGILLPNFIDFAPALTVAEFADGVTLDLYNLYVANRVIDNQTLIGGDGDVVLIGGMGNDIIRGGSSTSALLGGSGDDILIGEAGTNLLMGGRGNDLLQGGDGHDTYLFNLGDGIDTIDDNAILGEGNRIQFGAGIAQTDLIVTHDDVARTLTIQVGSSGTDQLVLANFDLTGTNGSLVVETLAFVDGSEVSLASLLGPSITIFGTDNAEVLVGTSGNDGIDAGAGNDTVYANAGNDLILAGEGDDVVSGDDGADTLSGGSGSDYLYGGDGDDVVSGDDDNDVVVGDAGNDTLTGGAGNDVLNGGAGADQLFGGDGDDTLYMDAADTVVTGGAGYDAVTVLGLEAVTFNAAAAEVEFVAGSSGNDVVTAVGSLSSVTFYGGEGDDQFTGGDGSDVLAGQGGNDLLTGGLGNDVLNGGEGDDVLTGDAGNDTFYAGTGADQVSAGEGDDQVSGDEGADTIFGGSGTDYLYGGDGKDVVSGDDGNDVVVGDAGNDMLTGGAGNDILNGGAGADQLVGGEGDDTLYIDVADTVVTGGAGYDAVTVLGLEAVTFNATAAAVEFVVGSSGNDSLTAVGGLSSVTFYGGAGNDQLTGGDGSDVLVGEAGADQLTGGLGNDVLNGGEGDDVLTGDAGNDTFYAGTGADQVSAGEGDDQVSGDEDADTILGGSGTDYLYGGDGNDVVSGDDGNDVVVGDAGTDVLSGGAGNDVLVGGLGNDIYLFNVGDGMDTISENDPGSGNSDQLLFGGTIDPLDVVLSRQANALRLAIHGTSEHVLIENWYVSDAHQVETVQAGNGEQLLSTQVDQLIQAMAGFTSQTGLTWDQAIDERPQDVQTVLAASWQ